MITFTDFEELWDYIHSLEYSLQKLNERVSALDVLPICAIIVCGFTLLVFVAIIIWFLIWIHRDNKKRLYK